MPFRFRLQLVLEHRTHLEDLAKAELGKRLRAQAECERQIAWLQKEHSRARQELWQREAEGLPADEFIMVNEYTTILRLQAMREQSRLPVLQAETQRARGELIRRTQARKALETIHSRHLAAYTRKQNLAEQRILDEVAVGAFLRRRRS